MRQTIHESEASMTVSTAGSPKEVGFWEKWIIPLCLIITTALSSVLIVAHSLRWTVNGSWYESSFATITSKRAAIQSGIQLLAALLALIHTSTVAVLIQHGSRLAFFNLGGSTTQNLKGWMNLGIPRLRWDLRLRFLLPIIAFSGLGLISSALWVGAMTPVSSTIVEQEILRVPSFKNTTLIKEYPSEISRAGPSTTTKQGLFTYSVGVKLLGSLIASGSSATTSDGSVRRHAKIDNTQYIYEGRSYGVGSSVGIQDTAITNRTPAVDYSFHEDGYLPQVQCSYNRSMDFVIGREFPSRIFGVSGWLPDSVGSQQYSEYVGHSTDAIVAVGVAHSPESIRRYVSIAAGKSYLALNATQCTVDFTPTRFNVSVGIRGRNITVIPESQIDDFDSQRNLTRTVVRQFELISNDLTNFYESILGNAFLSSITAWNISSNENGTIPEAEATLRGLENAVTAMTESILAAYGAAQLMVGNFSEEREANVTIGVFVIGEVVYVVAIAILNALVLLAVVVETIRTRGWKGLPPFDFSDPEWLITASFRGGELSRTWNRDAEGILVAQSTIKGPISSYTPIDQRGDEDQHHVEVISEGEGGRRVALMLQSR
ncbi:unnamed protein product [Colletotrichum noveboracense]|uniref:Uncharacterized protein n=1 Tax=Colletotrichum noveboracense TaxID=2664923 RepID=A0A9W4RRR5_9PEZI|nr:unnamed protein product [Colletotrichum noveboracense]